MKKILLIISFISLFIVACAQNPTHNTDTNKSQLEIRNYQARHYDTSDKSTVLNAIVATMLDLGFIVEKADDELGIITGSSSINSSKITVSVRFSSNKNIIVRVNAQYNNQAIDDPTAYSNFFNSLSQSLFLEAHEVE